MNKLELKSGAVVYPEVKKAVSPEYSEIVSLGIDAVSLTHEIYKLQKERGYYPADLTTRRLMGAAKQNPALLDQHQLVRESEGGQLVAVPYRHEPDFAEKMDKVSAVLRKMIIAAEISHLPDRHLIRQLLEPQARSFEEGGSFENSMAAVVNLSAYPVYPLFAVQLDRYDDHRGIKLGFQPLFQAQDRRMSEEYTTLVQQMLADDEKDRNCQVIAGDILALGGYSTTRPTPWSANTIPSEEYLRLSVAARVLLLKNSANAKFLRVVKPLLKHIPQAERLPDAEALLPQAARNVLIGHEAGHVAFDAPEGADLRIRRHFTTMKEAVCDAWGLRGWAKRVGSPIDGITREMFMGQVAASVAWALSDIRVAPDNLFQNGENGGEGENGHSAIDPYPLIGAMWINSLLRNNALMLHKNKYLWTSFDRLLIATLDYYDLVHSIMQDKRMNEGIAGSKIENFARDPYDFFVKAA